MQLRIIATVIQVTLTAILTRRVHLVRIPFDYRRAERADHPSVGHAGSALRPGATASARDDSAFRDSAVLAVALATAAAALIVGPVAGRTGRALSLLAGLMALLSFGPQKYLDPQFPLIWPAVLAAQVAVIAVFVGVLFRQGQRSA